MNHKFILSLPIVSLVVITSCTRTANKTGPLIPYPEVTADIDIGEQIRGEGTRAELLGFIRWGDPGRATFEARPQEHALGGKVVKQSMQSAVYDALDGQPDNFIVDPHFHTVEHNFLVFKTATTQVVGRKAKHDNYRQIKRFNTDGTETLSLDDAPQEVVIRRNGSEASRLTTTPKIKSEVMSSVQLYDTSAGVKTLDLDNPEDQMSPYDDLRRKLDGLQQRVDRLK
ncbi:MAG: hypothetical protein P8N21_02105 [Opitutales bacterium]|nr:hypothetical protein [Opitutales bacterium]